MNFCSGLGNSIPQILRLQSLCIGLRDKGFTQDQLFCANIKYLSFRLLLKCINKTIFAALKKTKYMSFSELFESGFKKRNEDHFAAIVRVAMSDGIINDAEKAFLDRLAIRLDITESEYKQILKDYQSHPINPPLSYDSRLERLYDLARMVWADHIEGENQVRLLEKLCIGLGFNPENVKYITDKALTLVHYEVDLDEFIDRMRNMNQ